MHVGHHVSSFVSSGIYTLEQKMSHNTTFDFNMINVYARTYICPTMYILHVRCICRGMWFGIQC